MVKSWNAPPVSTHWVSHSVREVALYPSFIKVGHLQWGSSHPWWNEFIGGKLWKTTIIMNHKFAVFPAAVPVGFQSLGLVAKPENQNGPRTELGTPSVGLQRWITVIWCLTEILLTSTSWNQGCSVAVERLGFWMMIWPSLRWRPAKAKDEDDKWKSPVLIGYSNNRKYSYH